MLLIGYAAEANAAAADDAHRVHVVGDAGLLIGRILRVLLLLLLLLKWMGRPVASVRPGWAHWPRCGGRIVAVICITVFVATTIEDYALAEMRETLESY